MFPRINMKRNFSEKETKKFNIRSEFIKETYELHKRWVEGQADIDNHTHTLKCSECTIYIIAPVVVFISAVIFVSFLAKPTDCFSEPSTSRWCPFMMVLIVPFGIWGILAACGNTHTNAVAITRNCRLMVLLVWRGMRRWEKSIYLFSGCYCYIKGGGGTKQNGNAQKHSFVRSFVTLQLLLLFFICFT